MSRPCEFWHCLQEQLSTRSKRVAHQGVHDNCECTDVLELAVKVSLEEDGQCGPELGGTGRHWLYVISI